MDVYITQVGASVEAVINSLWRSAIEQGDFPDKIYLLWNEEIEEYNDRVVKALQYLSNEYDFQVDIDDNITFDEDNISGFARTHEELIKSEIDAGNKVTVDTTPGRKFMSGISMKNIVEYDTEGYYLHLKNTTDFRYNWLPEIPVGLQNLVDIKELERDNSSLSKNYIKSGDVKRNVELNRDELIIILNYLVMQGKNELNVSAGDNNEVALCDIQLSVQGNNDIAKVEIKAPNNEKLGNKIGDTSKIRTLMQYSGIFDMYAPAENNEFEEDLNEEEFFERVKDDLDAWNQAAYICYDTNAFLAGVPERFEKYRDKHFPSVKPLYLISGAVENEIKNEKGKLPYDNDDHIYSNQPTPKDRMFKLGWGQLELLQKMNAETISSYSIGDKAIKQSLQFYLKHNNNKKVIFVTADNNCYGMFVGMAGQNITPYFIKHSYPDKPTTNWSNIGSLIYAMATYFGRINMSGIGDILGVWKGKPVTGWYDEYLKIKELDEKIAIAINSCRKLRTYCSSKDIHG